MSCRCTNCTTQKNNELAWENARLSQELLTVKDTLERARAQANEYLEQVRTATLPGYAEVRAANWVVSRVGEDHMQPRERAMRLLEEAIELAQAEGVTENQVRLQVGHVYNRPPGDPIQEAGGIAVCLLAWCVSRGKRFIDVAMAELERIEAKSAEAIRGSLARKADSDLVTCVTEEKP